MVVLLVCAMLLVWCEWIVYLCDQQALISAHCITDTRLSVECTHDVCVLAYVRSQDFQILGLLAEVLVMHCMLTEDHCWAVLSQAMLCIPGARRKKIVDQSLLFNTELDFPPVESC